MAQTFNVVSYRCSSVTEIEKAEISDYRPDDRKKSKVLRSYSREEIWDRNEPRQEWKARSDQVQCHFLGKEPGRYRYHLFDCGGCGSLLHAGLQFAWCLWCIAVDNTCLSCSLRASKLRCSR